MKLSFLGHSYEASIPAIDAVPTTETGRFMGRSYVKKQYRVAQHALPQEELTYRGHRYTR